MLFPLTGFARTVSPVRGGTACVQVVVYPSLFHRPVSMRCTSAVAEVSAQIRTSQFSCESTSLLPCTAVGLTIPKETRGPGFLACPTQVSLKYDQLGGQSLNQDWKQVKRRIHLKTEFECEKYSN